MDQNYLITKYPQILSKVDHERPSTNNKTDLKELQLITLKSKSSERNSNQNNGNSHNAISIICRNDLDTNLKSVIFLGRILLIIPPCGRSRSFEHPFWKLATYLGTIFIFLTSSLQTWADVEFLLKVNNREIQAALNYMLNLPFLMSTITSAFINFYFVRNSNKFYKIFDRWEEMSLKIHLAKDSWLPYLAILYTLIGEILSVTSVALLVSNSAYAFNSNKTIAQNSSSSSELEMMYKYRMPGVSELIPYNPAIAGFFIGFHFLQMVTNTYVCLLIVVFARALSFQFRMITEDSTEVNMEEAHCVVNMKEIDNSVFWKTLVKNYKALLAMTKAINNFLSPLIFIWMAWSVYLVSIQLYRGMVGMGRLNIPKKTFLIDFILRVIQFVFTLIEAAKVNSYAVKLLIVLRNCPKEHYRDTEVYRLEHQVSTSSSSIGFTGMGCFTLTKPFLLKVFNAVFTMEMILLQSTNF